MSKAIGLLEKLIQALDLSKECRHMYLQILDAAKINMPFKTYSTMRNNQQSYLKFGSSQISFSIDEEQSQRFRLELDYEGASIHMGPNGPCFELIYLLDMGYEGWIGYRFTFV